MEFYIVILVTDLTMTPHLMGALPPRAREMIAMRPLSPCRWGPVPLGPTAAHEPSRCHWGPAGEAEAPTLDHDEQMTEVKA